MAYLFIIENNRCKPNPETLLLEPFSSIWSRDASKDKMKAVKEFTYIEFMVSKKKTNPFSGYDDATRKEKLINYLFKGEKFQEDELIKSGMLLLDELQKEGSPSYTLYKSTCRAIHELARFLNTFDINERDDKGKLILTPAMVTSALKNVADVAKQNADLKEKVEQELFETQRTKANKEISMFAK